MIMIDDKKIEAAKEEIYEDRFLLNGEEIVFNNDEKEEMFYKEDIKEAIGLAIAPNKRSKQGKAIAAVLTSYKSFTHHFKILKELNIEVPHVSRFSITQLLRHKDRIFVYFDDSIRAEKQNPDFVEITIGEYEDLINSKD